MSVFSSLKALYRKEERLDSLWLIVVLVSIVLLFIGLHPRVTQLVTGRPDVDALQLWWQVQGGASAFDTAAWAKLRETYSPGTFTYDPNHVTVYSVPEVSSISGEKSGIFQFQSNWIESTDSVVSLASPAAVPTKPEFSSTTTMWQSPSGIIAWDESQHKIFIWSIAPADQMISDIGMLQVTTSRKMLKGTWWVTEASIKVPRNASWQ